MNFAELVKSCLVCTFFNFTSLKDHFFAPWQLQYPFCFTWKTHEMLPISETVEASCRLNETCKTNYARGHSKRTPSRNLHQHCTIIFLRGRAECARAESAHYKPSLKYLRWLVSRCEAIRQTVSAAEGVKYDSAPRVVHHSCLFKTKTKQ